MSTRTSALSYTAGCYPVPIRFLYGTAAEINFWDIVCFHSFEAGGPFDTSTEELADQSSLSRQMISQLRREAVEQKALVEDVSWVSGRRFTLHVPNLNSAKSGIAWKPLGYVHNGWQRVVTPAIPKRVLNLYLQQPRQQIYHLDAAYIAGKCKRRFPYEAYCPAAPLNTADIGKALRLLVQLGLLVPEGDGFRVDWVTFNQPAPSDAPRFEAPDPRTHSLFRQAASADPGRAERSLELLSIGHYELETHLADIFRDLAYVGPDDYALLKAKVYRRRNRPPGPKRWHDTWKAFQYELKRRVAEARSPKTILDLSEATHTARPLHLEIKGNILAMRMVSRVEWPWYLDAQGQAPGAAVQLELQSNGSVFFSRTVNPGDAEMRYTFQESPAAGSLTLHARCKRPLPGVHVAAWLEARLRK
ncbi:MAG: hypothetical protein JW850_20350 [Thermoflexales bacterium]|nr:hypothetical protein [Thermoflexales bacterium]